MYAELKQLLKRSRALVMCVRSSRRFWFALRRASVRRYWLALRRAIQTTTTIYRRESREEELRHARTQSIESYMVSRQIRKLQIGAGPNRLEGWLNADLSPVSSEIVFLDARERFPFEDRVFDYVFSEHLIEHLTYREGLFMLGECYRILKPGGKLRTATPNIEQVVGLYSKEKSELQTQYLEQYVDHLHRLHPEQAHDGVCFVVNSFFRAWHHQFLYDPPTLQAAMEGTGFVEITQYLPGESGDGNLCGIESHGSSIGDEMNRFETMVLEATRPNST